MSDNVWIGVDYRSPKYDRIEDTDPLESYQGKWAVQFILDNGTSVCASAFTWKDTEGEVLRDIEVIRNEAENANNMYKCYIMEISDSKIRFACMFNRGLFKRTAKRDGYPICISMFPIPVK